MVFIQLCAILSRTYALAQCTTLIFHWKWTLYLFRSRGEEGGRKRKERKKTVQEKKKKHRQEFIYRVRKIEYDEGETANYKPNFITIMELFHHPTKQTTVLCKEKSVNPHLTILDRELQMGVMTSMCIPISWDFLRPQRVIFTENFQEPRALKGKKWGVFHEGVPPRPQVVLGVTASSWGCSNATTFW